jgi:hypothetical protein
MLICTERQSLKKQKRLAININLPFHQLIVSSACHSIYLSFHQHTVSSTVKAGFFAYKIKVLSCHGLSAAFYAFVRDDYWFSLAECHLFYSYLVSRQFV